MGRLMGAIAATLLVAGCAKDDRRSCTVTQTRCSGSVIEICDGAAWSALNDCATNGLVCSTSSGDAVCTNASSVDAGQGGGGPCMPLMARCNGAVYERCAVNGMGWEVDTDCGATGQQCQTDGRDKCVGEPCARGSDPEYRCTSAGVSQICAAEYTTYVDCAAAGAACDASTGRCFTAGACTDNEQRCNGSQVEFCNGGGWRLREDCAFTGQTCQFMVEADCVGDRRCINGETRCSGDSVETCADGAFTVSEDCASRNMSCKSGACEMVECTNNGEVTCNGDVATLCEGGRPVSQDCGMQGQVCNPLGPPLCRSQCLNNTSRCNGDAVEVCDNGRYTTSQTCDNGCVMLSRTSAACA